MKFTRQLLTLIFRRSSPPAPSATPFLGEGVPDRHEQQDSEV